MLINSEKNTGAKTNELLYSDKTKNTFFSKKKSLLLKMKSKNYSDQDYDFNQSHGPMEFERKF